jgi:hypothetical protein
MFKNKSIDGKNEEKRGGKSRQMKNRNRKDKEPDHR